MHERTPPIILPRTYLFVRLSTPMMVSDLIPRRYSLDFSTSETSASLPLLFESIACQCILYGQSAELRIQICLSCAHMVRNAYVTLQEPKSFLPYSPYTLSCRCLNRHTLVLEWLLGMISDRLRPNQRRKCGCYR